jgi:hypothetical protein
MAVTVVTAKMAGAINYTHTTDTSADWPAVPNDTYFYDIDTELVYYKNPSGVVISIYESTAGLVDSVTGLNTDNSDPNNPVVQISVDGVTVTGSGTPADPLTSPTDGVESVTGNLVDNTDPKNPIVNGVEGVTGNLVDNTDPTNPIVSGVEGVTGNLVDNTDPNNPIVTGVQGVTGLNTDNTDPANPIVQISTDGLTITGDGTPGSPLSSPTDGVESVSGLNTDNTDPKNPIVNISVDNTTITGEGTPTNPLVSTAGSAGASLIFYATDAASPIPSYNRLVTSISDPDYNTVPVDLATGAITTTSQLIGELASDEGVINGNPGIINIATIGNIRRISGAGTATFYFEIYHRDNLGTETLLGTSNDTNNVSNATYEQYFASALIVGINFTSTDRVVTKWYANRIAGGSDPSYEIQLGGTTPVKITLPVPASSLPTTEVLNDLLDVTTGLPVSPTNADDGRVLYYDVDTGQWISDDIANIANVVKDCKTSAGGSIPKGTPVYLAGYDNDLLVVEACDAANAAEMPCIGITAEALDDTNAKKVVSFGKIQGFDTSLWPDGTELYVAVGGGFTTTRPTGTALIQRIAVVLKGLDAAGGSIKVFNTSRTAGLPNLPQDNIWVGDANGHPQAEPLCPFLLTDLLGTDTIAVCRWNGSSFDRFAITGQSILDLAESIYQNDGTLTGNRQVLGAGFSLSFLQLNNFLMQIFPAVSGTPAIEWDVDTSNMAGGDEIIKVYDINALQDRFVILRDGIPVINNAYSLPNADGNPGDVLTTNGAGVVSFVPGGGGGGSAKFNHTTYAFDFVGASGTWNGVSVASVGATEWVDRWRVASFAGNGGADGFYINFKLSSEYTAGTDLRVVFDFAPLTGGGGGNAHFGVGVCEPRTVNNNFGDETTTTYITQDIAVQPGDRIATYNAVFSGTNLEPLDQISVVVYRDPGNAGDTNNDTLYVSTIIIEEV